MLIGKTSSSVSLSELFEKYSEAQILSAVFPEINTLPCRINSPFRIDTNPSFGIYLDDNQHVRFKDFGDAEVKGGLFDLLCKYWNCSFTQAYHKILDIIQKFEGADMSFRPKQLKTFTRKESSELTRIQVVVRSWKDYDLEYWNSYGINKKWLQYAEIYPISYKVVIKKDSKNAKSKKYVFPADKLAYVYVERKDGRVQLKVYQPENTKGYKWCSSMDSSVISLWTKVPEKGDKIIIASSMKDALVLSAQLNIPAIAPQGEGYSISKTAQNELKERFDKVYICLDTDEPGKKYARKLAKETGFKNVVPDLGSEKDISDFYKSLENKEDFQKLKELFN